MPRRGLRRARAAAAARRRRRWAAIVGLLRRVSWLLAHSDQAGCHRRARSGAPQWRDSSAATAARPAHRASVAAQPSAPTCPVLCERGGAELSFWAFGAQRRAGTFSVDHEACLSSCSRNTVYLPRSAALFLFSLTSPSPRRGLVPVCQPLTSLRTADTAAHERQAQQRLWLRRPSAKSLLTPGSTHGYVPAVP